MNEESLNQEKNTSCIGDILPGNDSDTESLKDEQECLNFDEEIPIFEFSSNFTHELRLIKQEIEEILKKKIKNLEFNQAKEKKNYVKYFKNYAIDRVGNAVLRGETGIAEGWSVPKYQNEFQSLLGLPYTEDHALAATLRIKRPRQECFNCLSIDHRVQDCPVKMDDERIKIHKNLFNSQAFQAQEQAQLFSSRYTNDLDSKENRGFVPGRISDQLKEALGIRSNQLPSFIYRMRDLGYPIGWLKEAEFKKTNLAVHDGDQKKNGQDVTSSPEEGEENAVEYDPDKIYTFVGFNESPPKGTIDESEMFGVRRYRSDFSREKFLSGLKIRKRQIIRRNLTKTDLNSEESDNEENEKEPENNNNKSQTEQLDNSIESIENVEDENQNESGLMSPKKRVKTEIEKLGTSMTEIPGTPIVRNMTGVDSVPSQDKFSENICAHKPYEMSSNTPGGSYQNIVNLTRQFKSNPNLCS